MKNLAKIAFPFILILIGCRATRNSEVKSIDFIDTNLFGIKSYLAFEKSNHSKDESYDHFVEISTGIYPNFNKHKLKKKSKRFIRADKSKFISEANYYYDLDNNVKLIFYEWNYNGSNEDFKNQYDSITNLLNQKIGPYDYVHIEKDTTDKTQRDEIKWTTSETKAYLFRFKNGFNQIRLAVYKD